MLGSDVASVDYIARLLNRKFIHMIEFVSASHLGFEYESPHVGMMALDYKDYSYGGQKESILYLEKIKGKWMLDFEKDDFKIRDGINDRLSKREQMKACMSKIVSNLRMPIDDSNLTEIRQSCIFETSTDMIRDHREYSLKEAMLR